MRFSSDQHNRDAHSIAQLIETKLIDMENFFNHSQLQKGVNISIVDDFTPQEERDVKEMMQNIYSFLKEFCERYEIKPSQLSLKKEIGFKAAMLLQEIAGTSLSRSGELDALKNEFDEYSARMTEMVNALYLLCKQE